MEMHRTEPKILKRYISQRVVSQIFITPFVSETVMDCTVEWMDGTIERIKETSRCRYPQANSGMITVSEIGLPKLEAWVTVEREEHL